MVRYMLIIAIGLLLSGCQSNEYLVGYSDGKKSAKLLYEEEISQLKSELESQDKVILDYLLIIERLKITDNEARKDLAWITFCNTLPWLEDLVCTPELMSTEEKLHDQVGHPDNTTLLALWVVVAEISLLTAVGLISLAMAIFHIAYTRFRKLLKFSSLDRQIKSHEITLQDLDDFKRNKSENEIILEQQALTIERQAEYLRNGEASLDEIWKDIEAAITYREQEIEAKNSLRKRFLDEDGNDD